MRQAYMKRGQPLRSGGRLNKRGSRTKAWTNARRGLKVEFARMGVTRCEANLADCMGDEGLGFAHTKKRRHLAEDELKTVALLCNNCHDFYELQGEAKMQPQIEELIARRVDGYVEATF